MPDIKPKPPAQENKPKLDLVYWARAHSWSKENEGRPLETHNFVLQGEFTNRSPRNMSLEFVMLIRMPDHPDGQRGAVAAQGEWKSSWNDPAFSEVASIPKETTIPQGILVFRFPKMYLENYPSVKDISKVPPSNWALRISDKVSGAMVFSKHYTYPSELKGGFEAIKWTESEPNSGKPDEDPSNENE